MSNENMYSHSQNHQCCCLPSLAALILFAISLGWESHISLIIRITSWILLSIELPILMFKVMNKKICKNWKFDNKNLSF